MSLAQSLAAFKASASQCDSLIANSHGLDAQGNSILPLLDRQQITVAALLNLFVAWETFLEQTLSKLMSGASTTSGKAPLRYVNPPSEAAARLLIIGTGSYFNYGNHEFVKRIVAMYFDQGYPFEPYLSAIQSDLADLKVMRNNSAHITSTTQLALEGLAQRIFGTPKPGINLYSLLVANDPRSGSGNTVFAECRDKLIAVASLIAQG